MSTRGSYGVRIDGVDKLAFNHWDSYPVALGASLVAAFQRAMQEYGIEELADLARHLRLMAEDAPVSEEEYDKYCETLDVRQEYSSDFQWYVMGQEVQGKLITSLRAGVMVASPYFILDSLFCEWAYIFNFDDSIFEVYRGFRDQPHELGRFADQFLPKSHRGKPNSNVSQYYPCALLTTYPFDAIPEDWVKQVDAMVQEEDE